MCNSHNPRRIDECMVDVIDGMNAEGIKTLACCCGHGKYPETIVVRMSSEFLSPSGFEVLSGKVIPRKTRFYIQDKNGYYFIPEICKEKL